MILELAALTSIPGSRDARRRETISEVSPSQVYEDIVDVSLFYSHFSSRKLSTTRITAVLVMLSVVSLALSIAASAASPCSIATMGVSSKFGVVGRKSY
jgi:hypothetical protein